MTKFPCSPSESELQTLRFDTSNVPKLFVSHNHHHQPTIIIVTLNAFYFSMIEPASALSGSVQELIRALKREIDEYNAHDVSLDYILNVLDMIDEIRMKAYNLCIPVLEGGVHYLRELLVSPDAELVFHTLTLLDFIVKNSGFILHCLIGRPTFMQTICCTTLKFTEVRPIESKKVGRLALDCVQAWGEAFQGRQELYPHICQVYADLRHKHRLTFPKPEFDPSRVPIRLGDISEVERKMAGALNWNVKIDYQRLNEREEGDDEPPHKIRKVTKEARAQPLPPLGRQSFGGEHKPVKLATSKREETTFTYVVGADNPMISVQQQPQSGTSSSQQQRQRIDTVPQCIPQTKGSSLSQDPSVSCAVCFDSQADSEGFFCANKCGTFTCWDCLLQCYTMASKPDAIQGGSNAGGELLCSDIKCRGPITVTDLARSGAAEAVLKAQEGFKVQVLTSRRVAEALQQQEGQIRGEYARIEQIKDADEKAAAKLRLKIVDTLTLRCPRCKAVFLDFDGCFALQCVNRNCGCGFCAWCLKDCGSNAKAHSHVLTCPENHHKGSYFATEEAFKDHHKKKRVVATRRLVQEASLSKAATEGLQQMVKKDLEDLQIPLGDVFHTTSRASDLIKHPSTSRGDPHTRFDEQRPPPLVPAPAPAPGPLFAAPRPPPRFLMYPIYEVDRDPEQDVMQRRAMVAVPRQPELHPWQQGPRAVRPEVRFFGEGPPYAPFAPAGEGWYMHHPPPWAALPPPPLPQHHQPLLDLEMPLGPLMPVRPHVPIFGDDHEPAQMHPPPRARPVRPEVRFFDEEYPRPRPQLPPQQRPVVRFREDEEERQPRGVIQFGQRQQHDHPAVQAPPRHYIRGNLKVNFA